jgi:hypothetical protein
MGSEQKFWIASGQLCLLQKDFLVFPLFRFEIILAELVNLDELHLVRVLKRWINAAPVDELAGGSKWNRSILKLL